MVIASVKIYQTALTTLIFLCIFAGYIFINGKEEKDNKKKEKKLPHHKFF